MRSVAERIVHVNVGAFELEGMLGMPEDAVGVVVFAHGSGSGRLSPRNQFVARVLREHGIGTFLLDLLSEEEAYDRSKVFDIGLLADRLLAATDWLLEEPATQDLPIGYFGASTGAAAALRAAAGSPEVSAVVSRGGRPDLAMEFLPNVTAPTLLIVGGADLSVVPLNRQAYEMLAGQKEIAIVPGATHLFEEPGALEEVARLAAEWFAKHMS